VRKFLLGVVAVPLLALSLASACGSDEQKNDETKEPLDPKAASEWPMYGHNLAGTRASADTTLSVKNVKKLVRKWEKWLPRCTATPAVVDGRVYVGDWFGNVHAFAVPNGAALWRQKVSDFAIDDSPTIADGKLFIGDGSGTVHARDAITGNKVWSTEIDPHPQAHVYSSPIFIEGMILIGSAALELVSGGANHDFTFTGALVALDAKTGAERWRTPVAFDDGTRSGAGVSVWSSFVVDEARGMAFIGTGQSYEAPASEFADSLIAVDYRTGDIKWHQQYTKNDVFVIGRAQGPDADIGATPNLFTVKGVDAVGVGDKAGNYAVFKRDTGEPLWPGEPLEPDAAPRPGFKKISKGSPQGGFMDSAAYAKGVLYMASNEVVSAIDDPLPTDKHFILAVQADTAKTLWKKEKPYSSVGGLAYANGLVFNIANDGTLYAVDAKNGEELWKDELSVIENGQVKKVAAASGPSIAGGKVFACHGFSFFKTGASPEVRGGLIAYGLPGGDDGGPEAAVEEDSGSGGGICETDAGVSECKRIGLQEGTCEQVVSCACDKCTCELERCQALPSCVAIRQCGIRTGCAAEPLSCYVGPALCKDVIDQNGGAMAQATLLALQLGNCTKEQQCPVQCGDGGSSTDAGDASSDAARDGGTTDASRDAASADVGPG
jgi:polyvinyl alcohol dehydrogenase (cytochrome)